ncbi:MAG TPA: helix-turn-helix domain-containing protein [Longimicrobiales bacterium]|nr:helix-turn-helix domain-containing protein [Longimicrobiales bacterium]
MGEIPEPGSLLGATRGGILAALCEADATARELAERFGISANAVRAHLTALQREGLVEYRAERRGVGKPAHVYELTPPGEALLSRGYAPLLNSLLAVLRRESGTAQLEAWLRESGGALAVRVEHQADPRDDVEVAVTLLRQLGGIPVVEERGDTIILRGQCCPLAQITAEHPVACRAVEGLLEAATGMGVREACDRSGRPHCRFELTPK